MPVPTLIYCAGGNKRFAQIAIEAGFRYGSQLPATVYHPVFFADQDWQNPNRAQYMAALEEHRPVLATVLDLEEATQLPEVLSWAEEAAQYVERVVIIPKAHGIIAELPRRIGGADIILGYSVATKYAGTGVAVWEFAGWPVHLLGGSPHKQMELCHYLGVTSVDGNMHNKMAIRFCAVYCANSAVHKRGHWPMLQEMDEGRWEKDAPYEAFRRSCKNIRQAWFKLLGDEGRTNETVI